jgi:hypothetical protein
VVCFCDCICNRTTLDGFISNIKAVPRPACQICSIWLQCTCNNGTGGQKPQFFFFECQFDTGRGGAVVLRCNSQLYNRIKEMLKDAPKKFMRAYIIDCHATSHKYLTDLKTVNKISFLYVFTMFNLRLFAIEINE